MPSERVQRRIDKLLDQAEQAADEKNWPEVRELADRVLAIDEANEDAAAFQTIAAAELGSEASPPAILTEAPAAPPLPSAFVSGRYQVQALLGEGARRRLGHAEAARDLRDRFPLRQRYLRLPQLADDLLRRVLLPGHADSPRPARILSQDLDRF